MCQLTFCSFESNELTRIFATLALITNARFTHHDGWGIFGGKEIFKTNLSADATSNIGDLVRRCHVKNAPMLCHVRLASVGAKVTEDNAHPFETKDFVLMHNGTLAYKTAAYEKEKRLRDKYKLPFDTIDSHYFLLELQEIFEDEKDFVKALTKTMDLFRGKFAFLIYNKHDQKYYVVRGKTADLHIVTFKKDDKITGVAVNTEKISLSNTTNIFSNLFQIGGADLKYGEITLLDAETIYQYAGDFTFTKVGTIKETEKEYAAVPFAGGGGKYQTHTNSGGKTTGTGNNLNDNMSNTFQEFADKYLLSVEDMDKLVLLLLEKNMLSCERHDIAIFVNKFVPRLACSRKFRDSVKRILTENHFHFVPHQFYIDKDFQWPFMMLKDKGVQTRFLRELESYIKEISS